MLGGSYYYNADRLKRKEFTDLVKKRKAQEKKDAWIRELEARDREDKEWREKMGKVRDFQREEEEREAIEELKIRDGRSDDGRGVIDALKGKMRHVKDLEMTEEAAELELKKGRIKEKKQEMEKKQEVERLKQAVSKQEAGMRSEQRVWGEGEGGLFGWKHIRNWYNRPRD